MDAYELAMQHYPRLWGKEDLTLLVKAGALTKAEMEKIIAAKGE